MKSEMFKKSLVPGGKTVALAALAPIVGGTSQGITKLSISNFSFFYFFVLDD
jgi:hypothetical protein